MFIPTHGSFRVFVNFKKWPFLIQDNEISIMLPLSPGLRREVTEMHMSLRDGERNQDHLPI